MSFELALGAFAVCYLSLTFGQLASLNSLSCRIQTAGRDRLGSGLAGTVPFGAWPKRVDTGAIPVLAVGTAFLLFYFFIGG